MEKGLYKTTLPVCIVVVQKVMDSIYLLLLVCYDTILSSKHTLELI